MTTIADVAEFPTTVVYVSSRWEIVDDMGYVIDEVMVEAAANASEREVEEIALCEFAAQQRDAYEPGHYKAEVVINSVSHARRV